MTIHRSHTNPENNSSDTPCPDGWEASLLATGLSLRKIDQLHGNLSGGPLFRALDASEALVELWTTGFSSARQVIQDLDGRAQVLGLQDENEMLQYRLFLYSVRFHPHQVTRANRIADNIRAAGEDSATKDEYQPVAAE